MRLWLIISIFLASPALAARQPSVVLSGPAPLTRWVGKELSKRYAIKVTARPVAASKHKVVSAEAALVSWGIETAPVS